ncbi:hypothetical protein VitviT2T_007085 [Vitis vinifera]|uniref:Uncharacterized protein n=1 Tax=Vitis vinifera TaxID=29760 RepID=A0ABY9BYB7_VITVI|nr:hypothetical protein VitviT2T_007085 [Vitis vinifera]
MAKTRGKQHLYGWILWNRGHQWNCYILNSVERLASAVLRFLGFQYFRIVWQRLLRLVLYLLTLRFGGGSGKVGAGVKRKTPSELRGEQLKQRNVIELVDESPAPLLGSTKNTIELKKQDAFEVPRCIDTHISAAPAGCLKNICVSLNSVVKSHPQLSWYTFPGRCTLFIIDKLFAFFLFIQFLISISPENTVVSAAVSKDGTRQDCEYAEKCSQSTFCSVAELSLGSERISEMAVVDMDKALKGLVACEPRAFSGLAADSSEKFDNFTSISSGHFCSEFHIPGQKAPLDFTLKTNMQIVSSSSVNWFHRLNMSAT